MLLDTSFGLIHQGGVEYKLRNELHVKIFLDYI